MGEWISKELCQIAKITKGQQLNKACLFSHGDYYVLNGGIEPSGYYSKWNTEANTISISEGGNSCGYVNYNSERFWSGGHCYSLGKINGISTECLFHILKYRQPDIMALRVGSGLPNIQRKALSSFELFFPLDVNEQGKIAQVLSIIDIAINKTETIIEKYKAVKEGLMQDLLANGIDENGVIRSPKTHKYKDSPLGKIPVEWECVELTEWSTKHSDSIVDGPFGSNLKLVHYRSSGIPVIQSGYVTSGHFVANNYVYVDMEKFREQYRCRVNPKDIVMAKIGANCGRSAVLPENHPQSIIAGNSLKITVNKQYVPELLHEFLEYYYAQGRFELIKAVTAQPAISLSNLKKMKIVLMSAPEQKRIWEKIDAINKMIMEEKIIYHKLLSTKTGLMQDLLTHKVPVDPLLERSVENE